MDATLASTMNSSFEFRSTILAIILAAYAFSVGRAWPENVRLPDPSILLLLVGIVPCIIAIYLIGDGYKNLGLSISGQRLLAYAADWPKTLRVIDILLFVSGGYLIFYVGLAKRPSSARQIDCPSRTHKEGVE